MSPDLILLSRVSYRDREITAARLRDLVALLAADLRGGCGTQRLIDELWPDERPENPAKALQILVSRTRSQLGPDLVVRTPTGYRLGLEADQVDSSALVARAAASAQCSRAGDHASALEHAEAGLALWDGSGVDGDGPLSALRADRMAALGSLERARALALSRLNRHAEALDALTALAGERPHDEEVLLELLRSEAATAGPAAALARYETYRRFLRDELGSDPGAAVQALHQRLLQGEPVRHNVAHEPNPLLGRDADLAAVTGLVRTSRVTSIVGPGGLGKTRLAQAVGHQAEQRVVHLVALAGVGSDDDVAGEVASVVGAGEGRIADALGPGALLILDNCEHVLRGAADLVRTLVSTTKDLRVLTTSRAPLGLSSESVYPLPELDLATSVALFEHRARAARPGVELPRDVVAELCERLDGLPLAVELAAARVRVLSVPEIAARLADRFTLLRGGPRDAPARHRTLRAVVDWSWNLLDPDAQAAMTALAVFPGGFTEESAGWLIDGDVLDTIEALVDQSLLKVEDTPTGTRFRMLETVREFAQGPPDERFLAWAVDFGTRYHDAVFGPDAFAVAALLRAEEDNLLHALRLSPHPAIAAVLMSLWIIESNYTRLAAVAAEVDPVLIRAEPSDPAVTALTLSTLYKMMLNGPRPERTLSALRRVLTTPPDTMVRAYAHLLVDPGFRADDQQAVVAAAGALETYKHEHDGDIDAAIAEADKALAATDQREAPWQWAMAHSRLAELTLRADDGVRSRDHLLAALPVLDRLGAAADVAGLRWWLVLANLRIGALDEAERWLELISHGEAGNGTTAYHLAVRAEVLFTRGETDAGLALWRRVLDEVRSAGDDLVHGDPPGYDLWVVEARSVAVIAHARHGALDLVRDDLRRLTEQLTSLLANPIDNPPPYLVLLPLLGAQLLAVGMADLASGDTGGVRLVALAEAFGYLRNFQPTMSVAAARAAAEDADGPAYADAVSEYAGLGREELRLAALAALSGRG
ncbi:BTAD domain-containing putative transcriptional regulator [Actinokineospora sp. UTMC 2448]|uniref:ATP-binding protein n=1 Tax=Actinokineospora sp. UTMC 2448 TaxID=2268449 RepID=UPI002164EFEC|nr:BTAD domain-containing putative transcriptional regulator [Actinokineospora sp. UTMC 2448]UVS76896.1 Regulatory protein AfsR [Actinokineospora sp. UTMC 2448]